MLSLFPEISSLNPINFNSHFPSLYSHSKQFMKIFIFIHDKNKWKPINLSLTNSDLHPDTFHKHGRASTYS